MLNIQQSKAVQLALDGHSLLLLGAAGTGKSFTIKHMVDKCQESGMNVSLTCTTGIACCVYPPAFKATTIHRWSGIGDGRHDSSEIGPIIEHNVKYIEVVNRVRKCNVLIIDECSMLSKRFLESLEKVCKIKNPELLFGGIQVVLCGDFRQLPPVPNVLYGEEGDYCFESSLFEEAFPHRVVLSEVRRQTETALINAIQETSKGEVSDTSINYIKSLQRPLKDDNLIKLFATNDQVADYNRFAIDEFPGPYYEFESTDTGELKHLNSILAPKILWLKILAPVILLRNLSDKLVNGLQGVVYEVDKSGPTIEFPSLGITTTLKKVKFSVFSPRQNKDVAVREQYPLKLAFGLTIHKSQGMTMDSVEVDCRGIFKPGQLGVAMGRASSSAGLRVVNFSARAYIKQPRKIEEFMLGTSLETSIDKKCCKVTSKRPDTEAMITVKDMLEMDALVATDIDQLEDTDFDEEFDQLIANTSNTLCDITLPDDLDYKDVLTKLITEDPITPWQHNTNEIVKNIDNLRYIEFFKKEYLKLVSIISEINKEKSAEPVKNKDLSVFSATLHQHSISAEFRLNCLMLFENQRFTVEHVHVCFNVSLYIRKKLLDKKAEEFSCSNREVTSRQVTNASRSRIRYVGGYCIAKVRHAFMTKKQSNRYLKSAEGQTTYEEAIGSVNILNSLREEEHILSSNTEDQDSLVDTNRRQNINKGLTNIPDTLFEFFVKLTEKTIEMLSNERLNKFGESMFEECKKILLETTELYELFIQIVKDRSSLDAGYSNSQEMIQEDIVLNLTFVRNIYYRIIKLFLMVMFNQFRKDVLESFNIKKKMAHRKEVRVSTKSKEKAVPKSKPTSTKQNISKPKDKITTSKPKDKITTSKPKDKITTPDVETLVSSCEVPLTLKRKQKGTTPVSSDEVPLSSKRIRKQKVTALDVETSVASDEDEAKCKVCDTLDTGGEAWIQCDSCDGWLHRNCAGLRHHKKWKKAQSKGHHFYCKDCE